MPPPFGSLAQFLDEVMALEDHKEQMAKLKGVRQVCINFSSDTWAEIKTLGLMAGFDPEVHLKRPRKKKPVA